MALGGPYFSPLLLNTIYAHAARHADRNNPIFKDLKGGEHFERKVKLLLMEEMEQKPKIPTVQALILLGGRQCSIGRTSQGWLYTGMVYK
jgi:hypothetical protein